MPNPYLPPFVAPKQKAAWGKKIIDQLSETLDDYKATAKAKFDIDPYFPPEEAVVRYRVQFTPHMPTQIPFLIGDAVHNLRASLDILMCDVAELRQKRRIFKFPFAKTKDDLQTIIIKDGINKLGSDVENKVLDWKPYMTNGHAELRALHDLDIQDKHRIIIPFFGGAKSQNPIMGGKEFSVQLGGNIQFFESQFLQLRKDVGDHMLPELTEITDPIFPDIEPFVKGKPVVPTLLSFHKLVCEVIADFEAGLNTPPLL